MCSQSKATVEKLTAELAEAGETRISLEATIASSQAELTALKAQLAETSAAMTAAGMCLSLSG